MRIRINSKNFQVTEGLESYVAKKVSKLQRFLSNLDEVRLDLTYEDTKDVNDRNIAQITAWNNDGVILRAEERTGDMRSSITVAIEKMERRIKKYKGKHWYANKKRVQITPVPEGEEAEGPVVRVKRFQTRPMDVQEAIDQMELLGHDFFIFYNIDTEGFSVVYRRRAEGYGLLIPELQ
ncbi:MAG: ribosome-associated translation inhibitor RaiA [Chloroflexota bacterium]|nr:ribosome-associated translation inhibitor RaiA [Chloroflexota bacterium]